MSEQRFTATSGTSNVGELEDTGFGGEVYGGSMPPEVALTATWNPGEQEAALDALRYHYFVVRKAINDSVPDEEPVL